MELYAVVGGQTDSLKRWEADLNAQFLPIYKDGKPLIIDGIQQFRRLLVAPVQLYKIAFPREELNNVLSMVGMPKEEENHLLKYSILRRLKNLVRKILGLKPVPNPINLNPFMQPNQVDKAIFCLPIGLKEDKIDEKGVEMI